MAKARVEVECTKCGRTYVVTKNCHNRREADNFEKWIAGQDYHYCPECYAQMRREEEQERREAAAKAAMNEADKLGLPELEGTEKQVAWAVTIRQEYIDTRVANRSKEDFKAALMAEVRIQRGAHWWIEHRSELAALIEPQAEVRLLHALPTEKLQEMLTEYAKWLAENADKQQGFVGKLQYAQYKKRHDALAEVLAERHVA